MTTTPSYLQDTVAWLRGQAKQCTELADRLEIVMAGPPTTEGYEARKHALGLDEPPAQTESQA